MTTTAYESEQQEAWAAEFRSTYDVSIEDTLDGGAAYREREKAYVQNRDAAEQAQIALQREALKNLGKTEKALLEAYDDFGPFLEEFTQRIGSISALRHCYEADWRAVHALKIEPLPTRIESVPIQANADTPEGLAMRQLITRYRVATATPLP